MKKLLSIFFLILLSSYSKVQESYSLTVRVSELKNSTGVVLFVLYNKDGSIPDDKLKKYYRKEIAPITKNSATLTFNNLPKGNYAVFILHDENQNNKIDKTFVLPTEGVGFSNFQTLNLVNRPNFSKASFQIKEDLIKSIKIIYK